MRTTPPRVFSRLLEGMQLRTTLRNGRLVPCETGNSLPMDVHTLSDSQMRALGMEHVAYIKEVVVDGEEAFAIHAADGTPMALTPDRDMAITAVLEHEMVPALVH